MRWRALWRAAGNEPGQGRDDVDGRFSLAGTVLGITAIVAALTSARASPA
jgi:hypothetical protein